MSEDNYGEFKPLEKKDDKKEEPKPTEKAKDELEQERFDKLMDNYVSRKEKEKNESRRAALLKAFEESGYLAKLDKADAKQASEHPVEWMETHPYLKEVLSKQPISKKKQSGSFLTDLMGFD